MPTSCKTCRAYAGQKHASWCRAGKESVPRAEFLYAVQRVVGAFGKRGYPEIKTVMDDGSAITRPVPEVTAEVVQDLRKMLRDMNLEPITL